MRRAYDVIVRVTVTANNPVEARRLVERFLPNPSNEDNQPDTKMGTRPNFPIDSWALLTGSRVTRVDANERRDIVYWEAREIS